MPYLPLLYDGSRPREASLARDESLQFISLEMATRGTTISMGDLKPTLTAPMRVHRTLISGLRLVFTPLLTGSLYFGTLLPNAWIR